MFLGHAALAFAVLAGAAALAGVDRRRALRLGLAAGIFATLPDVDILYALVGLAGLAGTGSLGLWSAVDAFWATGSILHRTATHSLLVGAPGAVGVALTTVRRGRATGVVALGALVGWVGLAGGPLAAAAVGAFLGLGVAGAALARSRLALAPREVLVAAGVGFLGHPFGDVFTGQPPPLLYPLDATLLDARVILAPDPTVHLFGAFAIELATLWLAVVVYARLRGFDPTSLVDRRAALGLGFAAAAPVLPAPTMAVSYHFVFGVVAFAVVGAVPARALDRPDAARAAVLTGLAAVTLAGGAYALVYMLV